MLNKFPKIQAWPCYQDDLTLLDILPERVCSKDIKEIFRNHMTSCYVAQRFNYPKESKDLYIVPFYKLKESQQLGLHPVEFAALWLPSIASDVLKIREILSEDLKENPIVAWDKNYSTFNGGLMLHMDPGFGEALFVLSRNQFFDYPKDWQFLAELVQK